MHIERKPEIDAIARSENSHQAFAFMLAGYSLCWANLVHQAR